MTLAFNCLFCLQSLFSESEVSDQAIISRVIICIGVAQDNMEPSIASSPETHSSRNEPSFIIVSQGFQHFRLRYLPFFDLFESVIALFSNLLWRNLTSPVILSALRSVTVNDRMMLRFVVFLESIHGCMGQIEFHEDVILLVFLAGGFDFQDDAVDFFHVVLV